MTCVRWSCRYEVRDNIYRGHKSFKPCHIIRISKNQCQPFCFFQRQLLWLAVFSIMHNCTKCLFPSFSDQHLFQAITWWFLVTTWQFSSKINLVALLKLILKSWGLKGRSLITTKCCLHLVVRTTLLFVKRPMLETHAFQN